MAKGSSSQDASTSTKTSVTDNRVGVADQARYAGAGAVVTEGNDFRSFDDHSQFTSVTADNRDFSDRSSFSSVDNSVTNTTVNSLDADVAREALKVSGDTAKAVTEQSTKLLSSALDFGESVTGQAFQNQNLLVESGFGAVTDVNKRSLDFAAGALKEAVHAVTSSADADRAFASEFTGRIFETAKSADQANTEKIIKAGAYVVGILAAAWTAKSIFGRN